MNRPSLEKFEESVVPGGLLLVNSSLIDIKATRKDIRVYYIPANELAEELGDARVAGNVILGALLELTGVVSLDAVERSLREVLPAHRHKLIPLNRRALETGAALVRRSTAVRAG
jgi:2-oxoglutarate ferredoxin oxidoreductase subunit gamma